MIGIGPSMIASVDTGLGFLEFCPGIKGGEAKNNVAVDESLT